ncbi:hypothetical protein E4U42_000202 [Claviceps africana]|uniref:HSF-type DNA-binding domain-containing protein n=1 Tax=Claviceps africana TaxID=83212 RepID=A0A8K0JCQ6_9HYPO|nr:hypothetical protein E4U42_000202 [Claviceps africana]
MSAPNSRKRAAPEASPMVPYQQRLQQPYANDNGVADTTLQWKGDGGGTADTTAQTAIPYNLMPSQPQLDPVPTPSNTLARRDANQALVSTHNRSIDTSVDSWAGYNNDHSLLRRDAEGRLIEQESIETLEEMAQKAKREAQAKRKSIPPFVQKLSSFLEEPKNEHFIRWSEKGDSFFVLDEDEFAKRLIPELFKHNNYASFVRQLNMYGFHKRVGLSDNSMRASERKNKSPSEYHNPFFRRGHPNLLWLINKPKGKPKGGQSKHKFTELDGDSDDDQIHDDGAGQPLGSGSNVPTGRALPPAASDSQAPPKKEMHIIRDELSKVREQQKRILGAITQLQQNNNDLYNQAILFQNQHDRHQNSINAILKFLANVFRKTLEDQANMQSVSDIISSMITNQGQQTPQQGSVVDLGDFFHSQIDPTATPGGTHKRARGLLPPIPNRDVDAPLSTSSHSASTSSTTYFPVVSQHGQVGHVTELVDGGETPPSLRHELENNPQERMMKIINEHNATTKSILDLPEAADLVANVPDNLSHDQRSKLADIMGGQDAAAQSSASPSAAATQHQHPQQQHQLPVTSSPALQSSTTAGISPPPADATSMPSMSPIMRSPQMAPPSLNQISNNQSDLDELQRLQSEQDAKIHELSEMLGPLSPSGRIPALEDAGEGFFDPPNVDLDQFFDSNAFLNDPAFGTDGTDFNFALDPGGGGVDTLLEEGNPITSTSSGSSSSNNNNNNNNAAPSPTGIEEIKQEDVPISPVLGTKRRKVG